MLADDTNWGSDSDNEMGEDFDTYVMELNFTENRALNAAYQRSDKWTRKHMEFQAPKFA